MLPATPGRAVSTRRFSGVLRATIRLSATPRRIATWQGSDYRIEAWWFRNITGYARAGGTDKAFLWGTSGDDTFVGDPTANSYMAGSDYRIEPWWFKSVTGYARAGGTDKAFLRGTSGDDTFVGDPTANSYMAGADYRLEPWWFKSVTGYARAGGTDKAFLWGTSGNDTFVGDPTANSYMAGSDYRHEAWWFKNVIRLRPYGRHGQGVPLGYIRQRYFCRGPHGQQLYGGLGLPSRVLGIQEYRRLYEGRRRRTKRSFGEHPATIRLLQTPPATVHAGPGLSPGCFGVQETSPAMPELEAPTPRPSWTHRREARLVPGAHGTTTIDQALIEDVARTYHYGVQGFGTVRAVSRFGSANHLEADPDLPYVLVVDGLWS